MPSLDFSSYYQNVIKPFSGFNQHQSFNLLFEQEGAEYDSSLVSRYVNGRKALPAELVLSLCQLNPKALESRLQKLFQDPAPCKEAAYHLVLESSLSSHAKQKLIRHYKSENPYAFLGETLITSIKFNSKTASNTKAGSASLLQGNDGNTQGLENAPECDYSDFLYWLDENNIYHGSEQKPGYNIPYVKRYELALPQDTVSLMYFAYSVCHKADVWGLSIEEFYSEMNLNPATMTIQEGDILFCEIRASRGEAVAEIISRSDLPMADCIIINIRYDDGSLTTDVKNCIDNAVYSKSLDSTRVYCAMTASKCKTGFYNIEMLLHVPYSRNPSAPPDKNK